MDEKIYNPDYIDHYIEISEKVSTFDRLLSNLNFVLSLYKKLFDLSG